MQEATTVRESSRTVQKRTDSVLSCGDAEPPVGATSPLGGSHRRLVHAWEWGASLSSTIFLFKSQDGRRESAQKRNFTWSTRGSRKAGALDVGAVARTQNSRM